MLKICSIFLITFGLYRLMTTQHPSPYKPAIKVLSIRLVKPMSQTEQAINLIATAIQPHVHIDHLKRTRLETMLKNMGHTETPEYFESRSIAEAVLMSSSFIWLPLMSVPLGLSAMLLTGVYFYQKSEKKLKKELSQRRNLIERELPQFASTIRQTLNSTRDIVAILSNYRKICGSALAGEIDKTLNEILTGNAQAAINALGIRVGSDRKSVV